MVRRRKSNKNKQKANNNVTTDATLTSADNFTCKTQSISVTPKCSTPTEPPDRNKSRSNIRTTPVNKERFQRRRGSFNRTMNVTNLNILFDSSYINQGTPPHDDSKSVRTPKANESMQTVNVNENIVETPRVSQYSLIDDIVSQHKTPAKAPLDKSKIHYIDSHVNLNPYIQHADVRFVKEPSFGEISFFTPQLYNKLASTPIDKIADLMKSSPIKESPNNVNSNVDAVKVDKVSNFAFQSTPLNDNTDRENLLNLQRSKTVSPKTHRQKNFTIVHNLSRVSKSNSGYRTFSAEQSERGVDVVFSRLKRLSRTSIKWTFKIVDWCNYIGVALRKVSTC